MLVDTFQMCPERVMRMPFRRFQALQQVAFRRSLADRNAQLSSAPVL